MTQEQKVLIELTEAENKDLMLVLETFKGMCKILGKTEFYHVAAKLLEKLKRLEKKP